MDTSSVLVALITLSASDFSQSAVNGLFKACIVAAGADLKAPRSLHLFDNLWNSNAVMSAIEALQATDEANLDTASARRHLLATIEAEIREPG